MWYQAIQNFTADFRRKENLEKWVTVETGYGRVTVETGCRARSCTNRFRILGGVYRMKKIHGMGYGIIGTGYGRNGLR